MSYVFTTVYILSASDSAPIVSAVILRCEFIDLLYIYICIDYICTIRDHNPPYIVSFENIDRTFDEQCYRNAKLIVVLIAM